MALCRGAARGLGGLGGPAGLLARGYADKAAAALLLDAVPLRAGDVLVQNEADSETGKSVIQLAKERGVKTINVIADKPGTAENVEQLKSLGGDVVVTESYTKTWYIKRLLSDLPSPLVALNYSDGTQATAVAQLLGEGGTLLTYQKSLPKAVPYPGSSKRPTLWSDYLKSKNITAKSLS